jgi:hypothetical protein
VEGVTTVVARGAALAVVRVRVKKTRAMTDTKPAMNREKRGFLDMGWTPTFELNDKFNKHEQSFPGVLLRSVNFGTCYPRAPH